MIKIAVDIDSLPSSNVQVVIVQSSDFDKLVIIDEGEALTYNESPYQIQEGSSYEYLIDEGYMIEEIPGVVSPSRLTKRSGRITPNIYVGTLLLSIVDCNSSLKCGELKLEVRSVKASYRQDYRVMLEEIAEKCTDLLMQHSSPVIQTFRPNFEEGSQTTYQRFAFIKSVIDSEEFENAVHKVLLSPTTKWTGSQKEKNIQAVKKFDKKVVRQIATSQKRIKASINNWINSVPEKVIVEDKRETVDSPENKFIKFSLETFLSLCNEFSQLSDNLRVKKEASELTEKLEQYLSHSIFKEITLLSSIPLNSPVLQRKEGYREVFRSWILFDLAAKLIWSGGEDVYSGGKRDVAILYEYWLFFKLVDVICEVFNIPRPSPELLIDETPDGFGLKLKQGKYIAINGVCDMYARKLNVLFSYNRTYSGEQPYPKSGSWSINMRPDYTLTIWPFGISEDQAEEEELIVHIHFDAKYRIDNFQEIYNNDVLLNEGKVEQGKRTVKRIDLLKMHAYKDAIRRTAGAYVLYPGNDSSNVKKGFHELVPGLGAFSIRPSKTDNGIEALQTFLIDIIHHFNNRASQREKMSFKTYENYKEPIPNQVNQPLPELIGSNRDLLPDETFVLVAFYRDEEHLKWIEKEKLYNARTGSTRGSLHLSPKETGAKYLLLHSNGETKTSRLFKLSALGPRIFSKADLIDKGYPFNPSREFYLVYQIQGSAEVEFSSSKWDITKLASYKSHRESAYPFAVSLTELMEVVIDK